MVLFRPLAIWRWFGAAAPLPRRDETLPFDLNRFVIRTSGWHQVAATLFAALMFLLSTAPIELQRRAVNVAVSGGRVDSLVTIALLYLATGIGLGVMKLVLNLYRGWIGESATRWLRLWCLAAGPSAQAAPADVTGVEISIVVAEAESLGAFVGNSLSEPVLQLGLLLSIFGYLALLQPSIAALSVAVLLPQFVVLPLMQRAINRRIGQRIVELRRVSVDLLCRPAETGASAASIDHVLAINIGIFSLKYSMNLFMNSLHHLGITAVLAAGGYFVLTGRTEAGTVVAFISGLTKVNDPWGDLVDWFRDFLAARAKYQLVVQSPLSVSAQSDMASALHSRWPVPTS